VSLVRARKANSRSAASGSQETCRARQVARAAGIPCSPASRLMAWRCPGRQAEGPHLTADRRVEHHDHGSS
jgi:hypothetical protein